MARTATYFSHDSGARNDARILKLRMAHGAEGYGIYFMVLEWMRDSDDYSLCEELEVVAFDLRCDVETLRSVLEDFGLFEKTENGAYVSASFRRRMEKMDGVSQKRREAVASRKDRNLENQDVAEKSATNALQTSTNVLQNSTNALQNSGFVPENKIENKTKNKTKNIDGGGGKRAERAKTPPPPPTDLKNKISLADAAQGWMQNAEWRGAVCETYRIPPVVLHPVLRSFVGYALARGNDDPSDWLKFFANCMRGRVGQKWVREAVEKYNRAQAEEQRRQRAAEREEAARKAIETDPDRESAAAFARARELAAKLNRGEAV